jgi:hypothetical protein
MKRYKVIKGNVGGFGNKTHEKGAEVTEDMFPSGNAETLVEMGFLKELKWKDKEEPKVEETEEVESEEETKEEETGEIKPIGSYNKDDIIAILKEREISFNPLAKKAELYELLK